MDKHIVDAFCLEMKISIYHQMLSSLARGDGAELSCCDQVSVQVSVPVQVGKKTLDVLH